jgi:hypothetical protein
MKIRLSILAVLAAMASAGAASATTFVTIGGEHCQPIRQGIDTTGVEYDVNGIHTVTTNSVQVLCPLPPMSTAPVSFAIGGYNRSTTAPISCYVAALDRGDGHNYFSGSPVTNINAGGTGYRTSVPVSVGGPVPNDASILWKAVCSIPGTTNGAASGISMLQLAVSGP